MAKLSHRRRLPKKLKSRRLSVMVLHRTKDTMALVDSIRAHKERLAAGFAKRYSPRLRNGETPPDCVLLLELVARDVKAALKRLIALDDRVDYGEVNRDLKRIERNALAIEELHPRAVSVRGAIDLAFGREEGRHFHGMKGKTRRRAPLLLNQLRLLVMRLEDSRCELPRRKNPHAHADRALWIRQLVPPYRQLAQLNDEVEQLRDHVVPALIGDKNAAMEAFDAAYGDALRLVTANFRIAGLDLKLIKNLKPYYQRRRLSQRAKKKRQARAAAADANGDAKRAPEETHPEVRETSRVAVSKTVMKWLEKNRLFGT